MPTDITINDITGVTPFDLYVCNTGVTTCVYIDTISSLPHTFQVPLVIDGLPSYTLKVIDNDGCIKLLTLTV
jgi:hypothetical protein